METIDILYLYPDMLELYGDYGNIQVLKYRIEKRGYKCNIITYTVGDDKPDFTKYDIVFAGGGADQEQGILVNDLLSLKDNIKSALESGVFFLLICGAYQLFGKYYKDASGNIIPGLEIFDYYTIANTDKKKRCIGNIVLDVELNGEKTKVIGFENHGGQTYDVSRVFGKVLCGNGNKFEDSEEGFFDKNIIATYLHGPLLSKNPRISDYIIKYSLDRKNNKDNILKKLDDGLEEKCRKQLIEQFLNKK